MSEGDQFFQINYRVPCCFWMLTAYDLETDDEEEIRSELAQWNECRPEDVELFWDTLVSYRG